MKDHSTLPRGVSLGGEPPVSHPVYGALLAEAWRDGLGDSSRAKADTTLFRNSWAGMCERAWSYLATDVAPTDPQGLADFWRMGLGTIVHERLQDAVKAAFPKAEAEVKVSIEGLTSGHLDLVDRRTGGLVALELKTVNGYGFKRAIGARGDAEGPKTGHKLQGALGGYGLQHTHGQPADMLVILYLSLENLSPPELDKLIRDLADGADMDDQIRRFVAEWHYPASVYLPWAEEELGRMALAGAIIEDGGSPHRHTAEMPPGAKITDPMRGLWTLTQEVTGNILDTGKAWQCAYCSHRRHCIEDGPS